MTYKVTEAINRNVLTYLEGIASEVRQEISDQEGTTSFVVKRGGPYDEMSVEVELNPATSVVTLIVKKYLDKDGHKKAVKIVLEMDQMPTLNPGDELSRFPEMIIEESPPLGDDLRRSR